MCRSRRAPSSLPMAPRPSSSRSLHGAPPPPPPTLVREPSSHTRALLARVRCASLTARLPPTLLLPAGADPASPLTRQALAALSGGAGLGASVAPWGHAHGDEDSAAEDASRHAATVATDLDGERGGCQTDLCVLAVREGRPLSTGQAQHVVVVLRAGVGAQCSMTQRCWPPPGCAAPVSPRTWPPRCRGASRRPTCGARAHSRPRRSGRRWRLAWCG